MDARGSLGVPQDFSGMVGLAATGTGVGGVVGVSNHIYATNVPQESN